MAVDESKIMKPLQAVILCGGLGTRLRPYTETIPKPMIPCNGNPFIKYLLEQLQEQGIRKILLLTGYLGGKIIDYFGDGRKLGLSIQYSPGPVEWDTGRRLWEARSLLEKSFLLLYSDNFVPFSLNKIMCKHKKCMPTITLMVTQKKTRKYFYLIKW